MAIPGHRAITATPDHWWIPFQARWADIRDAALPPVFDGLKQAARHIGGAQVQNAGTLVGNLCNASPAADGIPCLLTLEATVELASLAGTRRISVADFVLGPRKTARRSDELVLGLRIPRARDQAASHFHKLGSRQYLVISIAMLAAVITRGPDNRITDARIAIGACGPSATRLHALDQALIGTTGAACPDLNGMLHPIDDIRATASYRRHAAATLLRWALAA
jgi:CO/xanthine dehydrogenase FAD-binding subunit